MTAYRVTIDHQDGTSEHHDTTQEAAYGLVLDELRAPTPGVTRVEVRALPEHRHTQEETLVQGHAHAGACPSLQGAFRPLSGYCRDQIRDAIDASGNRGLKRSEIWQVVSRSKSLRQVNTWLAELLATGEYEEFVTHTGESGRPPVRYRRCKPSSTAGDDATRALAEAEDAQ